MELQDRLVEIADADNLPSDHPVRIAARDLSSALSRSKAEKDFAEVLINAQAAAFAAYSAYTGISFPGEESGDE